MKNYVLVHGAWEGSWAWEDVTSLLEKRGDKAIAVDLPGSYGNMQPVSETTLESYIKTTTEAIGKVTLVAHSLGGATISQIAERMPEKIERLVYVASFLLKNRWRETGPAAPTRRSNVCPASPGPLTRLPSALI